MVVLQIVLEPKVWVTRLLGRLLLSYFLLILGVCVWTLGFDVLELILVVLRLYLYLTGLWFRGGSWVVLLVCLFVVGWVEL